MEKEVAVLVDKDGNITLGTNAAAIIKFVKAKQVWKEDSKIWISCVCAENVGHKVGSAAEPDTDLAANLDADLGLDLGANFDADLDAKYLEEQLKRVRSYYEDVANKLESCRIIVGSSISGLMYKVFCDRDYVIMETDTFTPEMLDDIYDKALKADEPLKGCELPLEPQPADVQGEYFFDFKQLKLKYRVTSKETIRPFLAKKKFNKLTILCDHRMPWLDDDLERLGLTCEEIREGSNVTLIIKPMQQQEAQQN